jgi:hypothetical protein
MEFKLRLWDSGLVWGDSKWLRRFLENEPWTPYIWENLIGYQKQNLMQGLRSNTLLIKCCDSLPNPFLPGDIKSL